MPVDPEFEKFCRLQILRIQERLNPPKGRPHYSGPRRPSLSDLDKRPEKTK